MTDSQDDTTQLMERARAGDSDAVDCLLRRHTDRLKRMVAIRMDQRVRARFDPSDVIQESLVIAHSRLGDYLEKRPLPFYPWLRGIAWEKLLQLQEKHLEAQKRSVRREEKIDLRVTDESISELAQLLAGSMTAPSERMMRDELRDRVRKALRSLRHHDREILELLYLEQLKSNEIAAVLDLSPATVRKRHYRALTRLSRLIEK